MFRCYVNCRESIYIFLVTKTSPEVCSFVVFSSSILRLLLELAIYSQAEFQGVLLCKPARSKEFAVDSSKFKSAVLQPLIFSYRLGTETQEIWFR